MTRIIRTTVLALALWPALAFAQAQPATAQLPEWDKLTPAQRDALIAPLRERWNSNPDERPRMLERAQRWKTMPHDQRDRARHGMQRWEHMSPEKRDEARALFHAMRGMDEAQRKAFLAQWKQKTPQQRAEWLKAHPAPERGREGPPPMR
ncbi:MAG: DUF3106 domain-containing protein [Thermomonas sp.]|uniref:DUF3106 domain-containing protein n=1 Tax=Thermomonas sp. TaxID=1971895 RepID=UPI0039E36D82